VFFDFVGFRRGRLPFGDGKASKREQRNGKIHTCYFASNYKNRTGHKTAQFGQPPGPVALIVAHTPAHEVVSPTTVALKGA
jgi:hypothetical protein